MRLLHPRALYFVGLLYNFFVENGCKERFPALPTPEVASVGSPRGTVRGGPTCRRCSTLVWSRDCDPTCAGRRKSSVWAGRRKGSHWLPMVRHCVQWIMWCRFQYFLEISKCQVLLGWCLFWWWCGNHTVVIDVQVYLFCSVYCWYCGTCLDLLYWLTWQILWLLHRLHI